MVVVHVGVGVGVRGLGRGTYDWLFIILTLCLYFLFASKVSWILHGNSFVIILIPFDLFVLFTHSDSLKGNLILLTTTPTRTFLRGEEGIGAPTR